MLLTYPKVTSSSGGGGGGADTLLFQATVTNPLNSTTTNQLARIPVLVTGKTLDLDGAEIADGVVTVGSSDTINVLYDDGGGDARPLNFDLHGRASDMLGNMRVGFLNIILPSLPASGTSHGLISVYKSSTALPTGTALTPADVLGLTGMANGGVVFECVIGGTTYSADLKTMLTAGSGAFSKTGARAEIWQSGPCLLHGQGSMPLMNGASPHASGDGLHLRLEYMAWKADPGAYNSSTNPILGLDVIPALENGAGDRVSPSDYSITSWSLKRMTSLTNATLITTSDTDSDGNTLTFTGSSKTAWYGGRFTYRVHIGQKPAIWAYGDHLSTGAKNTTDDQHNAYIRSTKLVHNFRRRYSDVDHSSGITELNASGANTMFPVASSGKVGEVLCTIGTTGFRKDIGEISGWNTDALCKWNVDGRRRIFENARAQQTYHWMATRNYANASSANKGVWPQWNDALQWSSDYPGDRFARDVLISLPASHASPWTKNGMAHHSECCFIAYLMTGHLIHLEGMTGECFGVMASGFDQVATGGYSNKTFYGPLDSGGAMGDADNILIGGGYIEQRGIAWATRTLNQYALAIPDNATDKKFVWSKTDTVTWLENNMTRVAAVIAANTGAGAPNVKRWADVGPRWVCDPAPGHGWQSFQNHYIMLALFGAHFRGMTNANLRSFIEWMGAYYDIVHLSDAFYQYVLAEYIEHAYAADGVTQIKTWADSYQTAITTMIGSSEGFGRRLEYPQGTLATNVTLSATTGSSVTMTVPSVTPAPFGAGAPYVGAKVKEGWPGVGTGVGTITAVNSGTQVVINVSSAFSGTSLDAATVDLPYPAPGDFEPLRLFIAGGDEPYSRLALSVLGMFKDVQRVNAAADYTTVANDWATVQASADCDYEPRAA